MNTSPPEHPMLILAQYVKDLSFENPNAPAIFGQLNEHPPEVTVNVDVIPNLLSERTYEVTLSMRVQAMSGDQVAFLIELDYAGILNIKDFVSEADMERLVFSDGPRHFFPFARNILADATRDAGFPPVVINPIDFDHYYERHKKDALKDIAGAQSIDGAADAETG